MSTYSVRDGVLASEVNTETVLLDAVSGVYFQLNETGAEIWRAIGRGESEVAIIRRIVEVFGADEGEATADVHELLLELQTHNLVS